MSPLLPAILPLSSLSSQIVTALTTPTFSPAIIARAKPEDFIAPSKPSINPPNIPYIPQCTQLYRASDPKWIPYDRCSSIHSYEPSIGLAAGFTVLFGLVQLVHVGALFFWRKKWVWPLLVCAFIECVGYGLRIGSALNPWGTGIWLTAHILIIIAPFFIDYFLFSLFARVIQTFSPPKKIWKCRAAHFAPIFITCDILLFAIQLVAGILSEPRNEPWTGGIVAWFGVFGQLVLLIVFIAAVITLWKNLPKTSTNEFPGQARKWKQLLIGIVVVWCLVMVRVSYIASNYISGSPPPWSGDGEPMWTYDEYKLAGFDSVPILLCLIVWLVVHPGRILEGREGEYEKGEWMKALKRSKISKRNEGLIIGSAEGAYQLMDATKDGAVNTDRLTK